MTCQDERSQLQNRESAMKILRGKLVELKLREQADERSRIKGDHVSEGWGSTNPVVRPAAVHDGDRPPD